jgi:hypothetical protein
MSPDIRKKDIQKIGRLIIRKKDINKICRLIKLNVTNFMLTSLLLSSLIWNLRPSFIVSGLLYIQDVFAKA